MITALLSACGGSSSGDKKEKEGKPSVPPTAPTTPAQTTANYSYYFADGKKIQVYSFDHESKEKELIMSGPTEITFSTQVNSDGIPSMGVVFLFKDGHWNYITPKDNAVKVIAEGSNIPEICDAKALIADEITYLYYATPGADKTCSEEEDNLSYRIDTSMKEDASALVLNSELFLADERQDIITNDIGKGFLIKKKYSLDTLLYSNLEFTSTVTLENKVPGYIRTTEFSNHNSIIVRFDNKLYDLTLEQLESGNIGEAFFTGTSVTTYSSRDQLYYSEGRKLYKYDLSEKVSTLVYELKTGQISDLEINQKGVLVQLDSGGADFLHISTSNLNNIKVTSLTLASTDRSSRTDSIAGGFTYSIENRDDTRRAFFVSDEGIVTTIENAEWINTPSNTLAASSLPVLLTYGDTLNTLSKWSVTTKTNDFIYGQLAKETTGMRVDSNTQSNTLLFTTLASEIEKKGLLYSFDADKADSLKLLDPNPGFTVAF